MLKIRPMQKLQEKTGARKAERVQWWMSRALLLLFCGLICMAIAAIHAEDERRVAQDTNANKSSPIAVDKKRDYGEAGFKPVAENEHLALAVDFTTGEFSVTQKSTGKVWYSNPQSRNDAGIKGIKGMLNSQIVLTYANSGTAETNTSNSFAQSVNMGGMDYELVPNGIKFTFAFPTAGIIVPIQYTLNGSALDVLIPKDEIQELWTERYLAASINVLPFFAASGEDATGYMLIPDGSASLIALNSSNYTLSQYMGTLYNNDPTLEYDLAVQKKESTSLPVFGLKWNDDGYLAIITSGEANARVYSYLSRKVTSYNQLYTQMTLRTWKYKQIGGEGENYGAAEKDKKTEDWSEFLYRGTDYAISYYFLDQDSADYAGMSRCYRAYLEQTQKNAASDLAKEQYLVLDVYGAVSIEKYVMGVARNVVTPLTTYQQVCDIVQTLQQRGVEHLIINYIGGLRGGMERAMLDQAAYEPTLGTQADFAHMLATLDEAGVPIFFEAEPLCLYEDGNGYSKNADCVRTYFDALSNQCAYAPNRTVKEIVGKVAYFLRPEYVPGFVQRFTASARQQNIRNVSLGSLGSLLYSDLNRRSGMTTRTETKALWEAALAQARQGAEHVMVHGGNAYCLPYADVITDVAMTDSNFDCESTSVPFYQMTLHGGLVLTTGAINDNADYQYMVLKAMETGMSLKFSIMAADTTTLVGTMYKDMVSYSVTNWLDIIVDSYHQMQEVTGSLGGEAIIAHDQVASGVMRTVYASGSTVLVNYNEQAFLYQGVEIAPRSSVRMEGMGNE